jgi:hypothetical protein
MRRLLSLVALFAALAAALAVISVPASALSCEDEFTGASGGKWNVAGNWNHGLPTSSTIVCWPAGTTVVGEGSDTADSILSGGSLETNGAVLTLADEANQSTIKNLTIDGGQLNGPGPLALTGNFLWTGSGPAGFSAAAAMALTQTGGGSFVVEGTGQAYVEGGSISTTSPIAIDDTDFIAANFGHGIPTLSTTGKVTFAVGEYSGNGGGGLTLEAAGFVTTAATILNDYNLDLTGNASSLGGSLTAASFSSQASTSLTVPGGVTLNPRGGTISGTVTGAGVFKPEPDGTTVVANGATLSTADVEVPVGTLRIEKDATYDASTATTVTTGGILEVGDSGKTGDLTLSPNGSDLGGGPSGGSLAVSGNFLWTGGSAELSEPHPLELTQSGGGEFKIEGTGQAYLVGGSISTSSPISITNPEFITGLGSPSVTTTGVLSFGEGLVVPENGNPDGTFTAASVAANNGSSYGLGADALVLTGPGTTTVASGHTLKSGPLTVSGGVLQDDGTVESASMTLTGGTLTGAGVLTGNLTNTAGVLEPGDGAPGELYVSGEYKQEAGGTLAIRLKGFLADTGYAQVRVKGHATFAGQLSLTDENGFVPEQVHEYEVVKSEGGNSGAFSALTGPSAGLYEVRYETSGSSSGAWLMAKPPPAPTNASPPEITGTPAAGQTLTCSTGTWTNSPTRYEYKWSLEGTPIGGATEDEYEVPAGDEGHTLTCTVTASNGGGAGTPVTSEGVTVIVPPLNTAPPAVSGNPVVGGTLTCSTGTWSNSPTSYTYEWQLEGQSIAGAIESTYKVPTADAGKKLLCVVTAINASGKTPAKSQEVSVAVPVVPPVVAPVNTSPPVVTGTVGVGHTLSCSPGIWSGSPSIFEYLWNRDNTPIAGAISSTYLVALADVGHRLTCAVTASNGVRSTSASAGVLVAAPPAPTPLPLQCSGRAIVLITVRQVGATVFLSGVALPKYAGQQVTIGVSKKQGKGKGGTATVAANGTFEAKLVAPSGAGAGLTRYTATVAGNSSLALKLSRALKITGDTPVAGGARVSFQVIGALGAGKHFVTITHQLSCSQTVTYKKVKLPSNGRFTLVLPAPKGTGEVSYYRAQTHIEHGNTFSLPVPVAAAG